MEHYNVKIDSFEGPLDLLLHLIHQAEVDIYHISVADITEQYLQYVRAMQELELNIASEYLVMAATLLEIKSKMLLPRDVEEDIVMDDEVADDPREELLSRLVEYKKYKEAAKHFREKEFTRGRHFAKPASIEEKSQPPRDENPNLAEGLSLFDMIEAYQRMKERLQNSASPVTTVKREELSIETRMDAIYYSLSEGSGTVRFRDLFSSFERSHVVVTFLAVLELMKDRKILCVQEGNFNEIIVQRRGDR